MIANVRFGSLADVCSAKPHVRFTPESRHSAVSATCPPWDVALGYNAAIHLIQLNAHSSGVVYVP